MKSTIKDLSVILLISLLFLWSFIAGVEQLVFYNMNQYPKFLINNTATLNSKENLYKLIDLTCPQGGADIVEKESETYVRCGLLWPRSKVMKIHFINKPTPKKLLVNY